MPLAFPRVSWSIAGMAAIPYLLFTAINYVDYPYGSGNYLNESAFCALLDINITPKVCNFSLEKRHLI